MPLTMAIVLLSPPCFRIGRYTDFWPSTRTMLVWIAAASAAWPISATINTLLPLDFKRQPINVVDVVGSWLLV